jgi:hypothetical protein
MRHQILDVFALEAQVAFAVAEQDAIAGTPCSSLGTAHHRRKERVDHVRDDQADGLGLLRQQPSGDAVRHIVELRDCGLDTALCLEIDASPAVDHPRNGHRRDPGPLSDIL